MNPIDEKMRESRLRLFDHVQKKAINALMRKIELIQIEGTKKGRERTKVIIQKQYYGSIREYDFGQNRMAEKN